LDNNKNYQIFTNGQGLAVLDELIQLFHAKLMFDPNNVNQTNFNLGQKDVIDFILTCIKELEQKQ